MSPTANMHDAVEFALAEAEALLGYWLIDDCEVNAATSQIPPMVTIVTDNGGTSAAGSARPDQNGPYEPRFGTMKIRMAVPGKGRRRLPTRRARERLPERLHPRLIPRNDRLEPVRRRLRRHCRPHHAQLRNRRNPANYLTQDRITYRPAELALNRR